MRSDFISPASVVAALFAALAGCGENEAETDEGTLHFTPLEQQEYSARTVEPPEPPVSLDDRPGYAEIVASFRRNAVALFERDGIDERLERIEQVFVSTGRYLELVAIYQDVVDELGLESAAAPRLAWAYIRLGQHEQASDFVDELDEARPDDPAVPFLRGALVMKRAPGNRRAAARALRSWREALERDPDFDGFGGLDTESLRTQIDRIAQRLDAPVDDILDGEAPERGGDGAGTAAPSPPVRGSARAAANTGPSDTRGSRSSDESAPSAPSGADTASTGTIASPPDAGRATPDAAEPDAGAEPKQPGRRASRGGRAARSDEEQAQAPSVGAQITRAELAASQGNWSRAREIYASVLESNPDHLAARSGLLRARWRTEEDARQTLSKVRELVEHPDMTAKEAYRLGEFAETELEDPELADSFRERVRELDPAFADRMGL